MDRDGLIGFTLRVVGGTACGTAPGAFAGLLLTGINNLVRARGVDAAQGSYAFGGMVLGELLLVPSVVGSVVWGFAFLRTRPRETQDAEKVQ